MIQRMLGGQHLENNRHITTVTGCLRNNIAAIRISGGSSASVSSFSYYKQKSTVFVEIQ
jgi:hypothetical protein